MSRCLECRSKGECEEWCGISKEELHSSSEYAYYLLSREEDKNKKLKKVIQEYYAQIVNLENKIKKLHYMDEDVDACLIRSSYYDNI